MLKQKFAYCLLFLFLSLFSFVTFGGEKLVLWTSNENVQKAVKAVAKPFEKEYGVKVEVVVLNKDLTTQFKTAALSNKGPDILTWAHDVVGELASSGLIEPINISKGVKDKFLKVAIDAFVYKGKLYGYPYDLEAIALIYNKKLVKNPPKTMKELIKVAKSIKKKYPKKYGFLYDINNLFFSFPLISASGGYIFKESDGNLIITDVGVANSGAIIGGKLIRQLVTEGIVPESTDRSISFNKMKSGDLAMTIDGPWSRTDLKKSGINFAVAPIPTLNGHIARPFVGVHGFMIRRSSKMKDLAKEFVENYLVSKSGVATLYKVDPRAPSRKDVLKSLSSDKVLMQFVSSAKNGIPMPNIPQMSAVWPAMGGALSNIVTGKQGVAKSLTMAKSQIDQAVSKK